MKLLFIILLLISSKAAPIGTAAGTINYLPGSHVLQAYDGSTFSNIGLGVVIAGGGCSATNEGQFLYDATALAVKYCNGTSWLSFASGLSGVSCSTAGAVDYDSVAKSIRYCNGTSLVYSSSAPGYFVFSNGTHDGNFGGLTGANSTCLTEVTSNNWAGKADATARGLLTSAHVKMFLCDSTTCQNPNSSSVYLFAVSGNTAQGGAAMTVDATGAAPNDSSNFSATDHFASVSNLYWSGRAAGASLTAWPNTPDVSTCTDWSDNTSGVSGKRAATNTTMAGRWAASTNTCGNAYHFVCFVNP